MKESYMESIKDLLKRYSYAKDFVEDFDMQIKELESLKDSKVIAKYGISAGGNGGSAEDRIININSEIDTLKENYKFNLSIVHRVEYGIEGLNDKEIDVVLNIYGTDKEKKKMNHLTRKYHYSSSQIYNIAKYSLKHISLRLYGDY